VKNLVLLVVFFAAGAYAQAGAGWLSRYWDGCKPSCSWSGKQYNGQGQCKECDKNDNKMTTNDANTSSCQGGNSYTCWDMSPWAVDNTTAYGFAAAHNDNQCGTCWQLTFNGQTNGSTNNANFVNGKKLIVMISNIGGDVQGNQLDFLVPGGGVGAFDAFSSQINVSKSALGAQYGGLVSDGCQGNPSCLKQKCDAVFSGSGRKEWLKAGCYFYADWMGAVDNPKYNAVSVTCPQALVDRWKNAATGTPGGSTGGTSSNSSGGGTSSNSNGGSSNCGSTVTASTETTKIEAECYTSKNGANIQTNTANGITSIGYIESGYSTTYKVNIPSGRAGQYTMQFRIATEVQSNFTVKVNNNNVGSISRGSTGNWNTYVDAALANKAQFNNGENTIVLEFGSAVNMDYFTITGGGSTPISLPQILSGNLRVQAMDNVIEIANLPNNAKIETYSLQGKLIHSSNSENSQILIIPVQTKGMYIVKVKSGSETKMLRVPVM